MLTRNLLKFTLLSNVLLWGITIPFVGGFTGLNILLLLVVGFFGLKSYPRLSVGAVLGGLLFSFYAIFTFLGGPCQDGGIRVYASLPAFLVQLIFCRILVCAMLDQGVTWTVQDSTHTLKIITFAAGVGYIFSLLKGGGGDFLRSGGIYLEPSHLAIGSVPLIAHLVFSGSKTDRFNAVFIFSFLFVFSYSSTLLILLAVVFLPIILGFIMRNPFSLKAISTIATFSIVSLLAMIQPKFEETLLRFNDVSELSDASNLSSLVYANGWQLLEKNIESTSGLGLGFNAMGCSPRPYTEVTPWLMAINLEDQNYNDGSFMLSKIGSEFGYFGLILLIIVAIYALIKLFLFGRRGEFDANFIYLLWFSTFSFSAFLRNAGGFFAGPMVLFIISAMMLSLSNRRSALDKLNE